METHTKHTQSKIKIWRVKQSAEPKYTCEPWGGKCEHGEDRAIAKRTGPNQCEPGKCEPGYHVEKKGFKCVQWGGKCENGEPKPLVERTRENECSKCDEGVLMNKGEFPDCTGCPDGQHMVGDGCKQYEGECAGGQLIAEGKRTQENHCDPDACSPGYYPTKGYTCTLFAGTCENGNLFAEAKRGAENECGSCNKGYKVKGVTCAECGKGQYQPDDSSESDQCTPCEAGKLQGEPGQAECLDCAGGRFRAEDGSVALHCKSCAAGKASKGGQGSCDVDCVEGEDFSMGGTEACTPLTTCEAGAFIDQAGTVVGDRSCAACPAGTWSGENAKECAAWTTCGVDFGVTAAGSATDDVLCAACVAGQVSLSDDSLSKCFALKDADGDGLFDRSGYSDSRHLVAGGSDKGIAAYDPVADFDQRTETAAGDVYDTCPLDDQNDGDADGICDGKAPDQETRARILAAPKLYAAGGAAIDACPKDPHNDADRDGKCGDVDNDSVDVAFNGEQLSGWGDKTCMGECADGDTRCEADCAKTAAFAVKEPSAHELPPLMAELMPTVDRRVAEVCKSGKKFVLARFSAPTKKFKNNCADSCGRHGLACAGALPFAEGAATLCAEEESLDKGACGEKSRDLLCKCVAEPQDHAEAKGNAPCLNCYATSEGKSGGGSMVSTIKLKKSKLSFKVKGAASMKKFVQITLLDSSAANKQKGSSGKGQPTISETVSGDGDGWYQVEWDVSSYVGKTAQIEIGDFDEESDISVAGFQFKDASQHGCLPSCMAIKDGVCGGKTCFYLEGDEVPYTAVKWTGPSSGTFCRAAPVNQGGSKLGPGLEAEIELVNLTYLTASVLPRCLSIDMKGSHYAIKTADSVLGGSDNRMTYAFERSEGTVHCVYRTLKPRCLDYSDALSAYKPEKKIYCQAIESQPLGCFDMCQQLHCKEGEVCGKSKSFNDCAQCCGANNGRTSGCFRRRRRLGSKKEGFVGGRVAANKMKAEAELAEKHTEIVGEAVSNTGCAKQCLNDPSCSAYNPAGDSCNLGKFCTKSTMIPNQPKADWFVWKGYTQEDLGIVKKSSDQKKTPKQEGKKRKKKKKAKKP